MGVTETTTKTFTCDRCADQAETDKNGPHVGETAFKYRRMIFGGHYDEDSRNRTWWLCAECGVWLEKFLAGRRVAE